MSRSMLLRAEDFPFIHQKSIAVATSTTKKHGGDRAHFRMRTKSAVDARASSDVQTDVERSFSKTLESVRSQIYKKRQALDIDQLEDAEGMSALDRQKVEEARMREDEQTEDRLMASRMLDGSHGIDPAAFRSFMSMIGLDRIQSIFKVTSINNRHLSHRVVLLRDGSHICTCRDLQRIGLACSHFFAAMVFSWDCRYHLRFINRRWFLQEKRDNVALEADLSLIPFECATSWDDAVPPLPIKFPEPTFMDNYLQILPMQRNAICPPLTDAVVSQRAQLLEEAMSSVRRDAAVVDQSAYARMLSKVKTVDSTGTGRDIDYRIRSGSEFEIEDDSDDSDDGKEDEEDLQDRIEIDRSEFVLCPRPLSNCDVLEHQSTRRTGSAQRSTDVQDPHYYAGKGRGKVRRWRTKAEIASEQAAGRMPYNGGSKKRKLAASRKEEEGNKKPRRTSTCGYCNQSGHNKATCPVRREDNRRYKK
ncbi:MAG: hypothetical protein JOS17DRAFT_781492 [Linnemannia elongata]|nr:MAG: hypothetical protein JOS17DRAFT_781492 [Linnemannia elongata]